MNLSPLQQIATAFAKQKTALMPYFTLGYPNRALCLDIITAIAPYSDLLELGVPFSDPLADGQTVQESTQKALDNGTTSADCLEIVRELRQRGVTVPILLMGYYNPILAYGIDRYVQDASAAGAQGFIVPDLPPEESAELMAATSKAEMALIQFLAPTSTPERIEQIISKSSGFIYMVSVTGVTGAREFVRQDLSAFVTNVKTKTNLPIAVGFGISKAEQIREIGQFADGAIVGSALINAVNQAPGNEIIAATQFVKQLRTGTTTQ